MGTNTLPKAWGSRLSNVRAPSQAAVQCAWVFLQEKGMPIYLEGPSGFCAVTRKAIGTNQVAVLGMSGNPVFRADWPG